MPIFGPAYEGTLFSSPQNNAEAISQSSGLASLPGMEPVSFGGSQQAPPLTLSHTPVEDTGFYVSPDVNESGCQQPQEIPKESQDADHTHLEKQVIGDAMHGQVMAYQQLAFESGLKALALLSGASNKKVEKAETLFQMGRHHEGLGDQQKILFGASTADSAATVETVKAHSQLAIDAYQMAFNLYIDSQKAIYHAFV